MTRVQSGRLGQSSKSEPEGRAVAWMERWRVHKEKRGMLMKATAAQPLGEYGHLAPCPES